jgi:hypothetical protein
MMSYVTIDLIWFEAGGVILRLEKKYEIPWEHDWQEFRSNVVMG